MEAFDSEEEQTDILVKVKRFEQMMSNQGSLYFDREDFQEITDYYLSIQDFESAETVLSYAFNLHPDSQELRVSEVHVLLGIGRFKEALDLAKEIEQILPDNYEVLCAKGSIYSRLKQSEKALNCFKKAIPLAEFKEEIYFLIAMEYQHTLEYEKALKYHKMALRENVAFELSLYEINICFDCIDKEKEAIKFYQEFLAIHPYSETAWFNLGVIYGKQDEFEKAIDAFDYALAINPYYSSALFNKANSLASWGKYKDAIECYIESVEHDFPTYITYSYIGECYERMNEVELALSYFDKSLDEEENYPDSWLGKAIALDNQGNFLEAYNCVQRAINLDNSEADYWYTCAEIEEKLGLIAEALESMRSAIERDTEDSSLAVHYSQMTYRNLDIISTKELVEELLERFPVNTSLLLMKAGLLLCVNKHAEAHQLIEHALRLEPACFQFLFDNFPESKANQQILSIIDQFSR